MAEPFLSPRQAADAEATLWRRGALRYLIGAMPILPPRVGVESGRQAYDWLRSKWGKGSPLVILAHRRFMKSSLGLTVGAEEAIRHPRCRVALQCDSKDHATDIVTNIGGPIFDRAPVGVRPTWVQTRRAYEFPNGSSLELFGGEKAQLARGRGGKFRAVILEEVRDHPYARLAVETVWKPALSDTAGSQLLFLTTVPEQEDNEFLPYLAEAEASGNLWEMPLSRNPDYPRSFYEAEAAKALGGEMGGDFQREYECRRIFSDDVRLIVPEFDPAARREIIRPMDPPPWARWMNGLDPGGFDPTGLVWLWYDERADHVHIARELQIRTQVTTSELAKAVRDVERDLFRNGAPNLERWADPADGTTLHNLNVDQRLTYRASAHDDLWGNFDAIRRSVQERTMTVDPSCTTWIHEATNCRRTKDGKKIQRDRHGHGDVLMSSYYVMRNLVRKPRPKQKPKPADPAAEMGFKPPPRHDIVKFLRRPYGALPDPLPGMRRRLR